MKILKFIIIILITFVSFKSNAQVLFSEIAWMGTANSANDEWIELYNESSESVDLSNYVLSAEDGSPTIKLSGELPGKSFYLLERTDDSTLLEHVANIIFTGALSNTGEVLYLKDGFGNIIDQVSAKDGWPAGDATTKQTMQKISNVWATANPTPNAVNKNDSDTNEEEPANQNNQEVKTAEEQKSTEKSTSSQNDFSFFIKNQKIDFINNQTNFLLELSKGENSFVKGRAIWYFGDGNTEEQKIAWPAIHNFEYPGEYQITVEYFENEWQVFPSFIAKSKIQIVEPSIEVTKDKNNIVLINKGNSIDLSGLSILNGNTKFELPKYLILQKNQEFYLPSQWSKLMLNNNFFILNKSGEIISENKIEDKKIESQEKIIKSTKVIQDFKTKNINKEQDKAQVLNSVYSETNTKKETITEDNLYENYPQNKDNKNKSVFFLIGAVFTFFCVLIIIYLYYGDKIKSRKEDDQDKYEIEEV